MKTKNEKRKMKNEKTKTVSEKKKKGYNGKKCNLPSKKYPVLKKTTASRNLNMSESVCERLSEYKSE